MWTRLRNSVVSPLLADLSDTTVGMRTRPFFRRSISFPHLQSEESLIVLLIFSSPLPLGQEGCKSKKWVCKTFSCSHGTDHCWKRTRCQYLFSMATCSYNPFFSNLSCTVTGGRFWYSQMMLKVGLRENKIGPGTVISCGRQLPKNRPYLYN